MPKPKSILLAALVLVAVQLSAWSQALTTTPAPFNSWTKKALLNSTDLHFATLSDNENLVAGFFPSNQEIGLWSMTECTVTRFPCPISKPVGIEFKNNNTLVVFDSQQFAVLTLTGKPVVTAKLNSDPRTVLSYAYVPMRDILILGTGSGLQEWDVAAGTVKESAVGKIISSVDTNTYGPPLSEDTVVFGRASLGPYQLSMNELSGSYSSKSPSVKFAATENHLKALESHTVITRVNLERQAHSTPPTSARALILYSSVDSHTETGAFLFDITKNTLSRMPLPPADGVNSCVHAPAHSGYFITLHQNSRGQTSEFSTYFVNTSNPALAVKIDQATCGEYRIRWGQSMKRALVTTSPALGAPSNTQIYELP